MKLNGLYPAEFPPPQIKRFQLSSVTGKRAIVPLDLGGFGISRFSFDHYLFNPAKAAGVESDFLFDKPEVISEISFETKHPVENHILMAGDAAGMIAPLCGNGMAMGVHAAKLVSELAIAFCNKKISRLQAEKLYNHQWKKVFF